MSDGGAGPGVGTGYHEKTVRMLHLAGRFHLCHPNKQPVAGGGWGGESPSWERIRAGLAQGSLLGYRPSDFGLTALDVDTKNGSAVDVALVEATGPLAHYASLSGLGRHALYRHAPGTRQRDFEHGGLAGQTRSDDGYLLLPPGGEHELAKAVSGALQPGDDGLFPELEDAERADARARKREVGASVRFSGPADPLRLASALEHVRAPDPAEWARIGLAVKHELGDAGWPVFDEWSRHHAGGNYDERENRKIWQSWKPDGRVTMASVVHKARTAGWQDPLARRPERREQVAPPPGAASPELATVCVPGPVAKYSAEGFRQVLSLYGVEAMWNGRHHAPYVRARAGSHADRDGFETEWARLDDLREDRLRTRIADVVRVTKRATPASYSKDAWNQYLNAHLSIRRMDTFKHWIEKLPEWDGVERLSFVLEDVFGASGDLSRWASRYVFCAPVLRTYEPGSKLDETPLLIGDKGPGKSTLLKHAFPPGHQDEWFADDADVTDPDKEWCDAVEGRVIVELSELEAVRGRKDIARMKARLSRTNDAIRASYGKRREERPRLFATIATSNDRQCVPADPGGTFRRLVPVECPGVPVEDVQGRAESLVGPLEDWLAEEVNAAGHERREQLWAEALHLVGNGYSPRLPRELTVEQAAAAETFRDRDSLEDVLMTLAAKHAGVPLDELPRSIRSKVEDADVVASFTKLAELSKIEGQEDGRGNWIAKPTISRANSWRLQDALKNAGFELVGRARKDGDRLAWWRFPRPNGGAR